MTSRRGRLGIVLLVAAGVLALRANTQAEDPSAETRLGSTKTLYGRLVSDAGIGADLQADVSRAVDLIQQSKHEGAAKILDGVLSQFAALMSAGDKTYVCFPQDEDFAQYLAETEAKLGPEARSRVTRVHDSFGQALQMKAFLAAARKDWDEALDYLGRKITCSPYSAQPHLEKGYVLLYQGKAKEALESYRKAYDLAVAHGGTKTEQAAALRGSGTALIELGKLDDAVVSFKKSLEIEPDNPVALNELKYIDEMQTTKP